MKIGQKLQTNLAWNIFRQQKTMNVLFCYHFMLRLESLLKKKKKKIGKDIGLLSLHE